MSTFPTKLEEAAYRAGWLRGRKYAMEQDADTLDDDWSAGELNGHVAIWRSGEMDRRAGEDAPTIDQDAETIDRDAPEGLDVVP